MKEEGRRKSSVKERKRKEEGRERDGKFDMK